MAAQAGDLAFGQLASAAGKAIVGMDLSSGQLTTIAPLAADAGGLGSMAVDLPWVVWEQLDSQTNLSNWSVHAWNQATGARLLLATSRLADGTYLAGPQPLPVLRRGRAAWAQPIRGTSGRFEADVRIVDLATRQEWTAGSGRVSSPVYAGTDLVWATIDGNGNYAFEAVDAETYEPSTPPDPIRNPASIGHLAGSSRYLVWSSHDSTRLRVWPIGSADHYEITAPDANHHFQFMQVAGDFVLWYSGAVSSAMDLRTGKAFDVQGTLAGSEERIVAAEPQDPSPRGQSSAYRIPSLPTQSMPPLNSC